MGLSEEHGKEQERKFMREKFESELTYADRIKKAD
jgi:hypothetical protein